MTEENETPEYVKKLVQFVKDNPAIIKSFVEGVLSGVGNSPELGRLIEQSSVTFGIGGDGKLQLSILKPSHIPSIEERYINYLEAEIKTLKTKTATPTIEEQMARLSAAQQLFAGLKKQQNDAEDLT